MLYPTNVQTNKAEVTRCKLATEAARQFYSTSFNSTEADLSSNHHAVQSDPTIMVIGRPLGKGEDHVKKSIIGCTDSVVISCITFRNGIGDETGSSFVLWLLIAESEARKPSFITSWLETARVWTTDVDNADQAFDFYVIVSQRIVVLSG